MTVTLCIQYVNVNIHRYIPLYDIFVSVHAMIFPFEVGGWHPGIERTESFARPRGAWVVNSGGLL